MDVGSTTRPGADGVATALAQWFDSTPGRLVAQAEAHAVDDLLPDLFGYHLLQLGLHHSSNLCASSRITHQIKVALGADPDGAGSMRCSEEALPIASGSVDVLLLPHVLEFADDPRRVLREAERVLIGEGHIVVTGFSPWSWFGVTAALRRWQRQVPWNAHLIRLGRVKDWLQLLGFDILSVSRQGFRPLTSRESVMRRLGFMESLGTVCRLPFANTYILLARKRVEGVTPLKAGWRQRRRMLSGSVAEPSARISETGNNEQ